jgi:hypothetical protein
MFSIVIATYNQENLVREAVDSVLAQTCQDWELIVVDDASKDRTYETLKSYGNRIQLIENSTNCGAIYGRNMGARMAKGDYVVFLDGDDVLLPWALTSYATIIRCKRPALIMGGVLWCSNTVPVISRDQYGNAISVYEYDYLVRRDRPQFSGASTMVVERETFARWGGWKDGMWPMEVDDLCLHLGYCRGAVQIVSPPTTGYRQHGHNTFGIGNVPPFADKMLAIVEKERAGLYPGGKKRRVERGSFIGGKLLFWIKCSVKAKCYARGARLLWKGWPMILAAVQRRSWSILKGRQPATFYTSSSPGSPSGLFACIHRCGRC